MKYLKRFNESFEQEKNFLVTDRFKKNSDITLSQSDIERAWDLSEQDFDSSLTLAEYLETCEAGDTWESSSKVLTCK
jgi:hypothetical protein